ncbi:MAG: hypothetical protein WAT37_06805 [Saprospiraceae bacterium]
MRISIFFFTCFCVFFLHVKLKAQSENDPKTNFKNKTTEVHQHTVISLENIKSDPQNFRLFSSRNAEVLFEDETYQCKIFRSFFTEFQDDIYMIKNSIKSGMFYEVDDLNNIFTTTEKIEMNGKKYIEIVTYKSDKNHIKLISMMVVSHRLKEFKPIYEKFLNDYLN